MVILLNDHVSMITDTESDIVIIVMDINTNMPTLVK